MPLVTRQGDEGWTRDSSGVRVSKTAPVIEAYGALDELVSTLGWLAVACPPPLRDMVVRWQTSITRVHTGLCGGEEPVENLAERLEGDIARLLPEPPSGFVTPGGNEASCRAHLVRVTCRSVERRVVAGMGHDCSAIPVLNRLSDALFALAVALDRAGPAPST